MLSPRAISSNKLLPVSVSDSPTQLPVIYMYIIHQCLQLSKGRHSWNVKIMWGREEGEGRSYKHVHVHCIEAYLY